MHEENIVDQMLARQPEEAKRELRARYGTLTTDPDKVKFIDRMVAESRMVALNHTAGLSLPQQVQMALFSLFALLDEGNAYRDRTQGIIHERFAKLFEGMGVPLVDDPLRVGYYANLDLEAWGKAMFGDDFTDYVSAHHDPLEIVMALARRRGSVLLNGSGFDGPPWAARVSLANLDADDYLDIGRDMKALAERAVELWRQRSAKK